MGSQYATRTGDKYRATQTGEINMIPTRKEIKQMAKNIAMMKELMDEIDLDEVFK